jgi:hypothetical protein
MALAAFSPSRRVRLIERSFVRLGSESPTAMRAHFQYDLAVKTLEQTEPDAKHPDYLKNRISAIREDAASTKFFIDADDQTLSLHAHEDENGELRSQQEVAMNGMKGRRPPKADNKNNTTTSGIVRQDRRQ